jgi:hypothetical protein
MKLAMLITASVQVGLLLFVSTGIQVPAGDADEPNLVIAPNTVRIQTLDDPTKGQWVVMPGFSERARRRFHGTASGSPSTPTSRASITPRQSAGSLGETART